MKHDWECVEAGNWYSEYKCRRCGEVRVVDDDDVEERERIEESTCPKTVPTK